MADTQLKNKLLRGAEQQVQNSLTSENKANVTKAVVMGMEVGLNGGKEGALASLRESEDPVRDCALAAVNLVQLIRMQSQGSMPPQTASPAGMIMMLIALDFAEQAGLVEIDMQTLVDATHTFTNQFFRANGITPQMLQRMGVETLGVMEDPARLEMVRRRAGTVRDPGASTPVEAMPVAAPRNRAERRRAGRRGR